MVFKFLMRNFQVCQSNYNKTVWCGFRFLRFQKEYQPPKDAKERVVAIAKSSIAALAKADEESIRSYKLTDPRIKFDFLSKVFKDFDHSIPNSMLYMISTIGEIYFVGNSFT